MRPAVGPGRHGGHASEDGYLSSVGDLMSAVLFVFIIAVVAFATQLKHREASIAKGREARGAILRDLEASFAKESLVVSVDTTQGVLHLPEGLLFDSAVDTLGAAQRQKLARIAAGLARVLPKYSRGGAEFQKLEGVFIEGHADSDRLIHRRLRDNLDLSMSRAYAVYRGLMAAEPLLDSLQNPEKNYLFSASGYGDRRPIESNLTEAAKRRNRRIDLRFVMATPDVPRPIPQAKAEIAK